MTSQIGEYVRPVGLTAAGLSLIAVCYGLARFAYGLFLPEFRNTFALDATTAGIIAAGSYAAYCAGVISATTATPRLGARAVAVGAGILATAGTSMIALAPDAVLLAVGVIVAGSSTGVASPPLAYAIARRVAPAARDRTQTIVNAGTGLGVMISGPVALLVQDEWRAAWLTFAGIAAVITVWCLLAVPAERDKSRAHVRSSSARRRHGVVRLVTAAAVMGAASAAGWTFGQDLLVTAGRHTPTFSTVAWIILGASGLLGAGAGDFAGRLGLGRAWAMLMIAMAMSMAALATAPQNAIVALVGSAVFGAVYIALTGLLLVWGIEVFDGEPARGVGVAFLVLALGQAGAAPLLGLVADRVALTTAFWLAAGLAVLGAFVRPGRAHLSNVST